MSAISEDTKVCFRFLEDDEFSKLESVYDEYKDKVPNPKLSRIAVAEIENGEIIGFLTDTLVPHITMWIDEPYRHSGLWVKLVEMILPLAEKAVEQGINTYVVCNARETEEMCIRMGLKLVTVPIYVKEV
jgi:hypothetical protein